MKPLRCCFTRLSNKRWKRLNSNGSSYSFLLRQDGHNTCTSLPTGLLISTVSFQSFVSAHELMQRYDLTFPMYQKWRQKLQCAWWEMHHCLYYTVKRTLLKRRILIFSWVQSSYLPIGLFISAASFQSFISAHELTQRYILTFPKSIKSEDRNCKCAWWDMHHRLYYTVNAEAS